MNKKIILDLINAWNTGSANAASKLYFENIWFRDSANPNGLSGNIKLSKYLSWLSSTSPDTTFKITELTELEPFNDNNLSYFVKWKYFVPDSIASKDFMYVVDGIQYLEFEGDLLIRSECYYDQMPIATELLVSSKIVHENCTSLKGCNVREID